LRDSYGRDIVIGRAGNQSSVPYGINQTRIHVSDRFNSRRFWSSRSLKNGSYKPFVLSSSKRERRKSAALRHAQGERISRQWGFSTTC
jgi:hypothetical protein